MELHARQQGIYLRKLAKRRDEIRGYMVSNLRPISDIVFRQTTEFESYEDGIAGPDFRPFAVGDTWGGLANGWFKLRFTVPEEWKGREVAAYINIGGEACAFIDGKPYQGVDPNHEEVLLSTSAKGGESYEIVLDARSGSWFNYGDASPVRFSRAEIGTRIPEVQEYWFNLETLLLLAETLPDDGPRRAKIVYTLNKSVDAFDYTDTSEESLKRSALAANKVLQTLLKCPAEASSTNVAVHGHSHIDVAWLWPYRETMRKCSRTFSTVMRMMEQYPDYIFTQSQAQLYEFTKHKYPTLYEDIKKRVKEGRWDVTGSMWVEADCNICSGESLVRQVLVGKNFFKDEFGIETDVLWLPDVFGYAAALPQILRKARVNYFSTIKINWSQFNHFPYNTFYWQGIDGTRVLAHFPPTTDYNAYPEPRMLRRQVQLFAEADRCDWSLMSYGWGDGGGGPDRRHLEFLDRSKDLEGLPKCHQMKVSDFFRKSEECRDLPQWVGELYLELHRGTYTTQGRNKWYNRKSELLYREAEFLGCAAMPLGFDYPRDRLLAEWKRILCNQFHDVIPGSSVHDVYVDTEQMYPQIMEVGRDVAEMAQKKIVENIDTSGEGLPIILFNSLSWDRVDIARPGVPDREMEHYTVVDSAGNEVPWQEIGDAVYFNAEVPSMGYSVYRFVERKPREFSRDIKVTKERLENRFYTIELDEDGVIRSIVHKASGREVVPEGQRANLLQLFEDKPNDYPAWDIDVFYDDKWEDITGLSSIEVVDEGPVCAAVAVTRKFGKSKIRQKMIIYSDNPRIDFETWVDWHEDNKCLKTSFPVDVNTSKARYEIQFGNVERPTHTNTSWDVARFEVAAHRWADLSEQDFGMSLMNDCKYGHHTKGNVMRLSLLRSPKEPDETADMGEHVFTYSIMPHDGDYITAQTVRRAFELNVPLPAMVTKASPGDLPTGKSFISVDADNVVLDTVKKAEKEEAVILRFYECHNTRARVNVKLGMPFEKVYECDLMEDNLVAAESTDDGFGFDILPFEIKTFKLI